MRMTVTAAAVVGVLAIGSSAIAADVELGKKVFGQKCAGCHGPDGKGNGKMEAMLKVKIPDLTAGVNKTDGELAQIVSEGKRPMPSFKTLSKEELNAVVQFAKSLGSGAVAGGK